MKKRIIGSEEASGASGGGWLDLEALVEVEITSEDPGFPIESALRGGPGPGWRAATPGQQTIRLIFEQAQLIQRVRLVFHEAAQSRTQEFVLLWSADGVSDQELLRQQYNFSPPGSTDEVEDYRVTLAGVRALTLQIKPEIGGGAARASLASLQLA